VGVSAYRAGGERRYKAILYADGAAVASKRGFTTKKAAQLWMQEARANLQAPSPEKETRTVFSSVAHAYLNDTEVRRQHNTYVYKRATANRLLAFMGGDFPLDDLTPYTIDAYMAEQLRKRGAKSANRDARELKSILNWGMRKGLCASNPFQLTERFAEEKFQRYVPPAEDIRKVFAVAEGQERDFLLLLYFTGARLSEVCNLRWEDVNFQDKTLRLWTRKRQGGGHEARTMAMVPALERMLADRVKAEDCHPALVFTNPTRGGLMSKQTPWVYRLLPALCDRAGVRRFTFHCIRHFVATRLKDSRQATPFQIQAFLGHKNLSTTERYLHDLDVDRGVATLLENPIRDKIEPQIEPQADGPKERGLSVFPEKPRVS